MNKSLIRLKVLSLSFEPHWALSDYVLQISNGPQLSTLTPNTISSETVWLEVLADTLEVSLMHRNGNGSEIGYADIRLNDICKFPDVLHKVNVYLSLKDKVRGWLERDAALVVIQLYCSTKPMNGVLNLRIMDADLFRDTELVSKMDPYVIIRYGGRDLKTSTKDEAGKKPIWNEDFSIPIRSINERMEIIVMDKDITKDDQVGRCLFSIREQGLITPKETMRVLDLVFKQPGKNLVPAGRLRIGSLFNF